MIQAKCIQKFRNKNNQIYGYRLMDLNGQTQDVQPNNLKQAIANKQIHVVNLTLTSDGRLIDTTEKHLQSNKLGDEPQKKVSNFERKCTKIIEYISKKTNIVFDLNTIDIDESDDEYSYNIESNEVSKNKLVISILIRQYEDRDIKVSIEIESNIYDNLEIDLDEVTIRNSCSQLDKQLDTVNKILDTIENVQNAKDLLQLACFIAKHSDDAMECSIEYSIKSLQNIYNIQVYDELKQRINKIINNKDEVDRLKNIICKDAPDINFINISDEDDLKQYISAAIYYEAIIGNKTDDVVAIGIMHDESNFEDFDIDVELNTKKLSKQDIYSGLDNYETWMSNVCKNKDITVNFGNILWRLDTFLGEEIGREMLMTNDKLREDYEKYNSFSFEDIVVSISNKDAYKALKGLLNRFKDDYQIGEFTDELVKQINLHL